MASAGASTVNGHSASCSPRGIPPMGPSVNDQLAARKSGSLCHNKTNLCLRTQLPRLFLSSTHRHNLTFWAPCFLILCQTTTTMGVYPVRDLQPGTLYITISAPEPPIIPGRPLYDRWNFVPSPYEFRYGPLNPHYLNTEEFEWGIYWHRKVGDGTWYRLHHGLDPVTGQRRPLYVVTKHDVSPSPRLDPLVVALVRVLRVPEPLVPGISHYLDWITDCSAEDATRTMMWAVAIYMRTRRHAMQEPMYDTQNEFDIMMFIWDTLGFALSEVWYGLSGQLPRPIVGIDCGVDLVLEEKSRASGSESAATSSKDASVQGSFWILARRFDMGADCAAHD
ncbi:hypothetical protein G7046_g3353 [Stylonectria norvegica]|nr:hypothetical protein G7046_g3353 [Stylonectria norvegica]